MIAPHFPRPYPQPPPTLPHHHHHHHHLPDCPSSSSPATPIKIHRGWKQQKPPWQKMPAIFHTWSVLPMLMNEGNGRAGLLIKVFVTSARQIWQLSSASAFTGVWALSVFVWFVELPLFVKLAGKIEVLSSCRRLSTQNRRGPSVETLNLQL